LDRLLETGESLKKPWIAVITKIDIPGKEHRTAALRMELEKTSARKVVSVSALNRPRETQEEVLGALLEFLPESPSPLYDPELYTTHNLRDLVSEIIREKCFEILHHELPYSIAIRINLFEEKPKITRIFAEILVEKENHKKMVIGDKGTMIKEIGSQARKDIEKLVGTKVFLDLKVTHRANWSTNKRIMEELGYAIPNTKS
jgi:GTPase